MLFKKKKNGVNHRIKAVAFLKNNYISSPSEDKEFDLLKKQPLADNTRDEHFEKCLCLTRDIIGNGESNKLKKYLSKNSQYYSESSNDSFRGPKKIINRFKYVNENSSKKIYAQLATIVSESKKHPEINNGFRCIVVSYGSPSNYESIAFITLNYKRKISNIDIVSDLEFSFVLDAKPLEVFKIVKVALPKTEKSNYDGIMFSFSSSVKYSLKEKADYYNQTTVKKIMNDCNHNGNIESVVSNLDRVTDQTFVDKLVFYISTKKLKDSTVYKAAQIDRRLFSKIMSDRHYKPAKDTAMALSLALELPFDEASDLLSRAGYTLSHSSKRDIIIEYFIREKHFNLFDINETLYSLGQKTIGR